MPLQPVLQQWNATAGCVPPMPPLRIEKLRAILPDLPPVDFALIAEQLSLQGPGLAAIPPMPPQRRRERLLQALAEGLAATTRLRPVLMVLEDAHWADPTTRELLALWMERVPTLRVLAVITARPEFVPRLARCAGRRAADPDAAGRGRGGGAGARHRRATCRCRRRSPATSCAAPMACRCSSRN